MALTPGTRLGVYEITAAIGAGGMGEVYRARDTKLNRDVAIKVLPESFANDPERLARFQREAQVLASLNHPNIAHIHGLEESGGVRALVMELVEGEDLAQRLVRGPIPLDEALPIAKQIAEALGAAHEQGIIHRDLKPANVKVRPDGTVKVLDFGLAKAMDPASGFGPQASAGVTNSPTLTTPAMMTGVGMILGTAAYMSPEQARGAMVDKRADLWAFGVVLWEMLTGTRLFESATVSDTLAAVLRAEPDWTALPATTPAPIRRLLRRCLDKDRKRRLDSVAAARLEIDEALTTPAAADGAAAGVGRSTGVLTSHRVAWSAAAVLVVVCASLAAVLVLRGTPPSPATISFDVVPPSAAGGLQTALSPDGRHLAASVTGDKASALWIRALDQVNGRILPGAEGLTFPFWSPDSRVIAFFAGGKLKEMDLSGAPPQTLADAAAARGGTWNRDNVIVFAPGPGPLVRVSASGGTPTPATTLDASRQETAHQHPFFLPDGRHFLYLAVSTKPENSAIYAGALDSTERTQLVSSRVKAVFAPPGYLLFARRGTDSTGDGTLMAQRFDPARLALEGDPFPVAENVGVNESNGAAGFAVSENGMLAHRSAGVSQTAATSRLIWFDRNGKSLSMLGEPGRYKNPRLSPDGTRVVVETANGSLPNTNTDLSLLDSRGVATRFTFDSALDFSAVWSPDGNRIAWTNGPGGGGLLYQKASSNIGKEEKLALEAGNWVIDDWPPAGDALLFHDGNTTGTSPGLRLLPLAGGGGPRAIGDAHALVTHARVSADGHWVAFTSSDSGKSEIYVQNFPTPTGRWRVSPGGGIQPVWRRDGKEIFYIAPDGKLMAAPLKLTQTAEPGTPVPLFDTHMDGGGAQTGGIWHQYDVTPDGTRFLVNTLLEPAAGATPFPVEPITVIVNWVAGLKK